MNDGQHIPQDDLALYAMQSLSAEEAEAVQSHLGQCGMCAEALGRARSDLALLALTVEEQPLPAGARERFLSRIAASAGSAKAREIRLEQPRHHRLFTWAPWIAAAALLLISLTLSIGLANVNKRLKAKDSELARLATRSARALQVMEVLTAPNAQHVALRPAKTAAVPSGRAIYLASKGSLVFQANNLAPLPEGKTYELWVIPANGTAPIPAGLFMADGAGNGSVVLPPIPKGVAAKAFGVTMEKAGGSQTPTAPILLAGAVESNGE